MFSASWKNRAVGCQHARVPRARVPPGSGHWYLVVCGCGGITSWASPRRRAGGHCTGAQRPRPHGASAPAPRATPASTPPRSPVLARAPRAATVRSLGTGCAAMGAVTRLSSGAAWGRCAGRAGHTGGQGMGSWATPGGPRSVYKARAACAYPLPRSAGGCDAIHQLEGVLHCCGLYGRHEEGASAPGSGQVRNRQVARHKWE